MFWTKTQFAGAIKAAANLGEQSLAFTEMEMGVLCAIAYHQPIDRAGLADIFGEEVSRELLARALQGPDRLWTAVAASGSAAYLRDDGYVSGDIRSSEPAGLAEAGNSLRTVRVVRLVWRCTSFVAPARQIAGGCGVARGELMKKLLLNDGREGEFRAVVEQIISEEEKKNNRVLARGLQCSRDHLVCAATQGAESARSVSGRCKRIHSAYRTALQSRGHSAER